MQIRSKINLSILKNKIVLDAFVLYVGRGTNLLIGLISTLIYGIIFQKTQIAFISLFEMITNLFLSFGFTWSTLAIMRFGKEELNNRNTINYTSSLRIGIIFPLLLISIFFTIIFRKYILAYIGTNDYTLIIYLILSILLMVVHEHINYIFTTVEKHIPNVVYFTAQNLGKVCILGIFYFKYIDNLSAELYIKLNVYFLISLLIVRIVYLDYSYVFPIVLGIKEDYIKFLKYVLPQIYGVAGLYIINWVDVYFIRKYWSLEQLGSYQFMYTIFVKLSSFGVILNVIFFPKIMEWKISKSDRLNKYLHKAPTYLFVSSMVFFILFLTFYRPIFTVFFKEKYIDVYIPFNILVLSLPFYFVSFLFVPVLNSYDRVKFIQIVSIIAATSNVLIDYFLIKRIGVIAAALGTFIAYFCRCILFSMAVEKMFNIKYNIFNMLSGLTFIIVIIYFCLNY